MQSQSFPSPEKVSQQANIDQNWEIGQIIDDRYEVQDVLARDNRKIIHKVRHLQWNIFLAVRTQLDEESRVQFFHQAERWVELDKHPNVVSAYYVQNIGRLPRLFVEYVKSKTLQQFIKEQEYDLAIILDIAIQICWGMTHAHGKKLMHGDLRPANIFISEDGEVKITDFRSREDSSIEHTVYMPPEQFEKTWVAVPIIDIHAFGVILYELCFKDLPFKIDGALNTPENREKFRNIALAPQRPEHLHQANSNIPAALSDLILKCISNTEERPRHFIEIQEYLQKMYLEVTGFQYPRQPVDPATLSAVDMNNRALSLLDLNQEKEAENYLQQAVAQSRLCTGAVINRELLKLRMKKGNLLELREATKPLLSFDREVVTFYRGWISLEMGGFLKEALAETEKAIEIFTNNRELLRLQGILLMRTNAFEKAIEIFDKLTNTESPVLQDIYRLTCCYLEIDKKQKALEVLEKAETLYPNNIHLALAKGIALAMRGKLDEARALFEQLMSQHPGNFWIMLHLAEITAAYGQHVRLYSKATPDLNAAKKLYEKLLEMGPRLSIVRRAYQSLFNKKPAVSLQKPQREISPMWSYNRRLEGQKEGIHCMSLSPDGRMVLVGGEDTCLRLWEIASGKCRNVLDSHPDGTTHITISHDGHFAVSSGRDNTIMVWDLIAGECVTKLEGHARDVTSFALSTTGYLVSGSVDRTLRIWDFGALSCQKILKGHGDKINCVAITPNGKLAISGSEDKRIGIWDIEQGNLLHFLEGHREGINYVMVSPDGRWLISGSWDQTMRIYDIASRECVAILEGHTGTLNCMTITPDSRMVISGSEDKTIRVWEIPSGKCIHILTGHTVDVTCIAVAPHGNFMVSGSWDRSLRIWDLTHGECLAVLEGHNDLVHTVAVTHDERFIISGGDDRDVKIWCDLTTALCAPLEDAPLSFLLQPPPSQQSNLEGQRKVEKLISQAEAKLQKDEVREAMDVYREIQTVKGFDHNVRVLNAIHSTALHYQLRRKVPREVWQLHKLVGHKAPITAVAICPINNLIISGAKDRLIKLWDLRTGACINTLEGHEGPIACLDISPNGRFVVSGSYDHTLRLWELEAARCIYKMEGHKNWVEFTRFTPDGRRIISASRDNTLRIWERKTGHRVYSLTGHTDLISALEITDDKNYLISGSHDRSIRVWELESGQCVHNLEKHQEHVKCIACIPNSSLMLSGGWDCVIYLWDIKTGEVLQTFDKHSSWINAVCVTQDGKRLISSSLDKTIRIWDIPTGTCLSTLKGHTQDINHISVTSDGTFCISTSWDTTTRIWDLTTLECCKILGGHNDTITTLQTAQNHRYIATGSKDHNLLVWEIDWDWE